MTPDDLPDALLLATLPNILFDGWTDRALLHGARSAGLDGAAVGRAFPRGVPDLLAHFNDWADRAMLARLAIAEPPLVSLKVRERIALAVRTRLEVLEPHKDAVQRSLVLLALPRTQAAAARALWRTVDAMWYAAGDTATDFNHYTKRGLLAGVLSSTLLYWLHDRSEGHEATWAFLDRRIADVLNVGRAVGRAGRLGAAAEAPWRLAAALRARRAR